MHDSGPINFATTIRVPIPMRMRFAAEVWNAMRDVPAGACRMRQARCFRLAMVRQKRLHMKVMRRNWR